MAKLPEKFEDWTPPWADGEFDEEKAAKRIFNGERNLEKAKERNAVLSTQNEEITTELSETKDKLATAGPASTEEKDVEIARLKTAVKDLEKNGRPDDKAKIDRLTVAMDHGLTARDAERLVGKNTDELAEDAAELATRLGIKKNDNIDGTGDGDDDGSNGGKPPERGVRPAGTFGNGRNRGGDASKVISAEDLLRSDAQASGLQIPHLTR